MKSLLKRTCYVVFALFMTLSLFHTSCASAIFDSTPDTFSNFYNSEQTFLLSLFKSKYKIGKTIQLGEYCQDYDESDFTPISWTVADIDEKSCKVLLISNYILDTCPYGLNEEETTWEDSYIRQWLNSEFYDNAFTDSEKHIILETYGHGNDSCIDKVFIPSYEELQSLQEKKSGLTRGEATKYAYKQGLLLHRSHKAKHRLVNIFDYKDGDPYVWGNNYASYWLRPNDPESTTLEELDGWGSYNDSVLLEFCVHANGIRPAIWIYKHPLD